MDALTSVLDTRRHAGKVAGDRRIRWLQLFRPAAGITLHVPDESTPDAEVCRLLAAGERDRAFERLLTAYRGRVYRLALSYVRTPADAEDLAQEAFVRLWRALPLYDGRASFSTWLYVIARNACLSELRRRGARPTAVARRRSRRSRGADGRRRRRSIGGSIARRWSRCWTSRSGGSCGCSTWRSDPTSRSPRCWTCRSTPCAATCTAPASGSPALMSPVPAGGAPMIDCDRAGALDRAAPRRRGVAAGRRRPRRPRRRRARPAPRCSSRRPRSTPRWPRASPARRRRPVCSRRGADAGGGRAAGAAPAWIPDALNAAGLVLSLLVVLPLAAWWGGAAGAAVSLAALALWRAIRCCWPPGPARPGPASRTRPPERPAGRGAMRRAQASLIGLPVRPDS